ncbi:hypothetical protein [Mesorhizobium sp. M1143]|uniref:hypothetical protein n=1 Tax=Mesorhizobium sp. M1143 TaxID=2957061 RepID=UPI00333A26D4
MDGYEPVGDGLTLVEDESAEANGSSAMPTIGQLLLVRCGLCNVKRWYLPSDLREIFGEVEEELVGRKMSCRRFGKNEYMHAETQNPSARERQAFG